MFAVRRGGGGGSSFTHHLAYECTLVEGQPAAQKLGTLIRFVVDLMCHVSVNTQKDHDKWWKHKEATSSKTANSTVHDVITFLGLVCTVVFKT